LALGFITAPALAALLFSIASPLYAGLPKLTERVARTTVAVLFVVYPIALILGVPAYCILRPRMRVTAVNCALMGAGIAALPWLFLSTVVTPDEATTGDVMTVYNHMRTLAGWMEVLQLVGGIACLGAIAGVVFWVLVAAGLRPSKGSA
jgi:hypothetical protein